MRFSLTKLDAPADSTVKSAAMAFTLSPTSARPFQDGSITAGAASDSRRYALLSDTHIHQDKTFSERDVIMYNHLRQAVHDVLALGPAAVMVNGDCAHHWGREEDYQRFVELIQPLRDAGWPIHLAMGNHDHRQQFWKILPVDRRRVKAIEDRQVLAISTPHADWLMLDSLDQTNDVPGTLGPQQLQWLTKELDHRPDKPVIVMVHHQPDLGPKVAGLTDTQQLLDVLLPRRQVKALLYGHTHQWRVEKREDLHCINLPAVAYVFDKSEPSGWVDAHLTDAGMTLKLQCLNASHPKHGETHALRWRV
jgi:3',5'-cyclic AMP phosphodiesterase CpdA